MNVYCCSIAQSSPTLCDPTDCSTPGFAVLYHLPELAQIHVSWVGDAIQPSHPLSAPSPAFSLSQHQGLFKWISSLYQVAKVLEFQLQQQSFQWIFRTDFLQDGLVGSLCCPRDSQESSPTPQFNSIDSGILINSILQNLYQNRKKKLGIFITISLHCQILYFKTELQF